MYFGENSNNNTITLNGNISTTGQGALGLYFVGGSSGNKTTINGNITTTGLASRAFEVENADSNTFIINGNIITTQAYSLGVRLSGGGGHNITINGNIITLGNYDAEPINLRGSADNTFTLSGAVHSLGGDQAITLYRFADNNTFILKRGVSFIGGLENNGTTNNTLRFDMGKASSYNLGTDGTTWILEDTSKPIIEGSAKSMGVADIDNQANILYQRMDNITGMLSARQSLYKEGQRPNGHYINTYITQDKRDEYLSEISGNAGGVTIGYALENAKIPMEALINFEVSNENYGVGAEQKTESNSMMAGLFLPNLVQDFLGGAISGKVLVGFSSHKAKRKVLNNNLLHLGSVFSEDVSGDYNSKHISAGAEWLTEFSKAERLSHTISVGTDLVQAYNEDYSAGEYKVDSRNMTQIQSRVQYGLHFTSLNKKFSMGSKIGVAYQELLSGEKQDYKINGTSTSYKGDDSNTYATAKLGAKYYLAETTNFFVDTKFFDSCDDVENVTVNFGFVSSF